MGWGNFFFFAGEGGGGVWVLGRGGCGVDMADRPGK